LKFHTKKDRVLEDLRMQILRGEYPPGTRIITHRVAQEYGVSAIPVREALNQLEQEGLVQIIPHVGAVTTPLSARDLEELFEVRIALERLAVEKAVPHLNDADVAELEAMARELEEAWAAGRDDEVLNRLNRAFHERLYQHSGNRRLQKLISDLWDYSTRYPPALSSGQATTADALREHRQILAALRARDGEEAARLTVRHKERAAIHIIGAVQRHLSRLQDRQEESG
jgi:DNA-binding GntR family transcriptional regulator